MDIQTYRHSLYIVPLCLLMACEGGSTSPSDPGAAQIAFPDQPQAGVTVQHRRDADLDCYRLTVTADVNEPERKFVTGPPWMSVTAFRFRAPWEGARFIKSIAPIIDGEVLHRGALYQNAGTAESVNLRSIGVQSTAELLFAWSHESDVLTLGASDGIAVKSGTILELEHQYGNVDDVSYDDASGAEVCVSATAPERLVGIAKLGVDDFRGKSVTAHCTPTLARGVALQPVLAHTGRRGVNAKLVHTRPDGSSATVFDAAPNVVQPLDGARGATTVQLEPGSKLSLTCTYDGLVAGHRHHPTFENCGLLALVSPPGPLSNNLFTELLHGANSCMDDPLQR